MDFIQEADPGIHPEVLTLPWGRLVSLTRQGRSTPWKIYLYNDGTSRLTKAQSKSLGPVNITFTPIEYPKLVHAVQANITAGYI